jgi:hypothetical protein
MWVPQSLSGGSSPSCGAGGRLCEPPLICWVWRREGVLMVVSTVDVPIVDMLGEVPHVMHPTVNVTHPSVHIMHVLGVLSGKGGEIGVHLLIKHLVCDLALLGSLRCVSGGLWCLQLRGHWGSKVGYREIHGRMTCVSRFWGSSLIERGSGNLMEWGPIWKYLLPSFRSTLPITNWFKLTLVGLGLTTR